MIHQSFPVWDIWNIPNVSNKKYYFNSIVYDKNLVIRMRIDNNKEVILRVTLKKENLVSYTLTDETYKLLLFDTWSEQELPFAENNFFIASYNDDSHPYNQQEIIHYCFADDNDVIEIISREAPQLEIISIDKDIEGQTFNQEEENYE